MAWTEGDGDALARIATSLEQIADSKNAAKFEDQRNHLFAVASQSAQTLVGYGKHLIEIIENEKMSAMQKAQCYREIAAELQQAGAKLMPEQPE